MITKHLATARSALLALTLGLGAALGVGTAGPAAASPFVGTWTGTWPTGLAIELTATHVDPRGTAYGLYCNLKAVSTTFIDLHPHDGVEARVGGSALAFEIGKTGFSFSLDADTPDTLELTHRRKGKTQRLTLVRAETGECATRVNALPPPSD